MDSNKEVREKILQGFVNTNDEINYKYRSRIIKTSIIIALIISLRIIFGPLVIPNVFGFPSGYNRYFLVKYNNTPISMEYKIVNKTAILPFFVYVKSSYEGVSKYTKEDIETFYTTDSEDVKIEVKSFGCYSGSHRVKCNYFEDNKKKSKKLKLETMKVTHTNKPYKVVYDGVYRSDIGDLLKTTGHYTINITGKYRNNTAYLTTYIIKTKKQIQEIEPASSFFNVY